MDPASTIPVNPDLLLHRDTPHDVGTQIFNAAESIRNDISAVVIANSRRVQEALRSLEEFGKLIAPAFSRKVKQIRYRSYTLQQQLCSIADTMRPPNQHEHRIQRLHTAALYVDFRGNRSLNRHSAAAWMSCNYVKNI